MSSKPIAPISADEIKQALADINKDDLDKCLAAIILLRKNILNGALNPDEIIDSGIMPRIMLLLLTQSKNHTLIYEILWLIINVTAQTTSSKLEKLGMIPLISKVLNETESFDVVEHAIWALIHFVNDSRACTKMIYDCGVHTFILRNFDRFLDHKNVLVQVVNFIYVSIDCGSIPVDVAMQFTPILARLIKLDDASTVVSACRAILALADNKIKGQAQADGIIERIVELIASDNKETQICAIKIAGEIASDQNSDASIDLLVRAGVVDAFAKILSTIACPETLKQVAFALSNILCSADDDHVLAVLEHPTIVPRLFDLLSSSEYKVKKEIVHCFWIISEPRGDSSLPLDLLMMNDDLVINCFDLMRAPSDNTMFVSLSLLKNLFTHQIDNPAHASGDRISQFQERGGVKFLTQMREHHVAAGEPQTQLLDIVDEILKICSDV